MTTVIDVIVNVSKNLLDKVKGVQGRSVEQYKEKKEEKREEKKAIVAAQVIQSSEKVSSGVNEKAPRDKEFAKRRGGIRYIDISVIDESSDYSYFDPTYPSGQPLLDEQWTAYRDSNPNAYFILFQPTSPDTADFGPLPLPTTWRNWQTDPSAPILEFKSYVTRPGDTGERTNWRDLIEGFIGPLTAKDKIRFLMDDSGSMTLSTVLADYTEFTDYLDEIEAQYDLRLAGYEEQYLIGFDDNVEEFWEGMT